MYESIHMYEFIYVWIDVWNDHMNSWSIWIGMWNLKWIYEFMRTIIQVYEFEFMDQLQEFRYKNS